jgi:hypothetical protein
MSKGTADIDRYFKVSSQIYKTSQSIKKSMRLLKVPGFLVMGTWVDLGLEGLEL